VLNAQGQTSVGVAVPDIVIAETISPDPGASSTPASAPSSWFPQPTFPQAPILYGNGDYTELEEYGGSGLDTGDEGDESTTGLLSHAIATAVHIDVPHIRIPPKCFIYVMTTTGRQSWMLPGVYVGVQFGSDMLSECHVGMRPPIAGQPACIKARDMGHALTICREQLVPAIYCGVRDIFGLTVGSPIPTVRHPGLHHR
jgi:hypothetical protein